MSASGTILGWFARGTLADTGAGRRGARTRRRPRFDDLEPRLLLSGAPSIREFPVAAPTGEPLGITAGPDGAVWFTESVPNGLPRIGRITPAGIVAGFAAGLTAERQPVRIVAGPDGNLWFTEPGVARIGRITPSGAVTEFSDGITPDSEPFAIAAGPDGNLWFTEDDAIGRITPAGAVTEFSAGINSAGSLEGIAAGPDGDLWFTEPGVDRIGRITPAGVVTEFSWGITRLSQPTAITAGPDGALWFTEPGTDAIGRITTAGAVAEFSVGVDLSASPEGIAAGPDGALWFTKPDADAIGRITTAGAVAEFSAGIMPQSLPSVLAAGPDGNLWLTEFSGHQVARIDLSLASAAIPVDTIEGRPFVGTVATFTDDDASAGSGDFTATIDWGDGTITAGQILEDATGTFYVSGSHTYAEEGSDIPFVVTIADRDGRTTIASGIADVAQAPLLASGVSVTTTEGGVVPAGTTMATFVDTGGSHPPGDYTANITWGDGTAADLAGIRLAGGNFEVVSVVPHTYKVAGQFTITVTILDEDPGNPRTIVGTAIASGTATVADAPLTEVAIPIPVAQPKGTQLTGLVVGSFFDGNRFDFPSDFTATIDWGDGSPLSLGLIAQPNGPGTAFVVEGSHTYTAARSTPYVVTVEVLDRAGRGLTTGTALPVAEPRRSPAASR